MAGYARNEYEDWDEYEEDGEEQEMEEGGYEEAHQPTQEELKFLERRQKLKEAHRSLDKINGVHNDNYGSFFGPSQPVISARVIQIGHVPNNRPINKSSFSCPLKSKSQDIQPPRVTNMLKRKADTRDYSFLLSDDIEVPASSKSLPPPRNLSAPKTGNSYRVFGGLEDSRPTQQLPKSSNNRKVVNDHNHGRESASNNSHHRDSRRPIPPISQNKHKVGSKSLNEPRKQLGSNNENKPKVVTKQAVPSYRDQSKRPPPKHPARHSLSAERPPMKPRRQLRDEASDDENPFSMIRQMFKYNPDEYQDDDDVSDMEANYEDIMREERRSAKIAREEDDEQQRLIEEEEKRERMRQDKKRKSGH